MKFIPLIFVGLKRNPLRVVLTTISIVIAFLLFGLNLITLRKLIHERLGYRNFNVLLHEHRIREACEVLSDSNQSHLPILTIALTAGYQSINPFNHAFRKLNGVTPSEYRKQAFSD